MSLCNAPLARAMVFVSECMDVAFSLGEAHSSLGENATYFWPSPYWAKQS